MTNNSDSHNQQDPNSMDGDQPDKNGRFGPVTRWLSDPIQLIGTLFLIGLLIIFGYIAYQELLLQSPESVDGPSVNATIEATEDGEPSPSPAETLTATPSPLPLTEVPATVITTTNTLTPTVTPTIILTSIPTTTVTPDEGNTGAEAGTADTSLDSSPVITASLSATVTGAISESGTLSDTHAAAMEMPAMPGLAITRTGKISDTQIPLSTTGALTSTESLSITRSTTTTLLQPGEQQFRYIFPIQPPEVTDYAAAHHTYPATDIFAPLRSAFVAVTDGAIDELSRVDTWDSNINDGANRSGLYVSIIGDDGFRYYGSHLDEVVAGIEPGDRVAAGQILGFVGNTGNARGITPHVHFGISHPTFPGDWEVRRGEIWPYQYLQAWTRGENLTPTFEAN